MFDAKSHEVPTEDCFTHQSLNLPFQGTQQSSVGNSLSAEKTLSTKIDDQDDLSQNGILQIATDHADGTDESEIPRKDNANDPATPGQLAGLINGEAFMDELNDIYLEIEVAEPAVHRECLLLKSRRARARIKEQVEIKSNGPVSRRTIVEIVEELEMQAHGKPVRRLYNRVATINGVSYIDIGDASWDVIKVDSTGHMIEQLGKPIFRRSGHQEALCRPTKASDPLKLLDHINVANEDDRFLVLAWVLCSFKTDGLCPILLVTGPQASGKSHTCSLIRSLVDPSKTPLLGEIELKQIIQTFQHQYVPCFENVSDFDAKTSDIFCRAVTGNGIERRRLFTDQEEVIFSFRRPIIINGITIPSKRLDLLDRAIVLHLKRLTGFKGTKELQTAFQADQSLILGSLLDLFAKTLARLPAVSKNSESRMVDFCHLGRAMMEVMGQPAERFDSIYRTNIVRQNEDVVEDSPLATLVLRFSKMHAVDNPWEGTTSELTKKLHELIPLTPLIKAKDIPDSSRWVSTNLMEAAPALKVLGVTVDRLPRTASARRWRIEAKAPDTQANMQRVREAFEGDSINE